MNQCSKCGYIWVDETHWHKKPDQKVYCRTCSEFNLDGAKNAEDSNEDTNPQFISDWEYVTPEELAERIISKRDIMLNGAVVCANETKGIAIIPSSEIEYLFFEVEEVQDE